MEFCTQCGNKIETNARFCGKCGGEILREEGIRSLESIEQQTPASNNNGIGKLVNTVNNTNGNKRKYNKKVISALLVAALIIGIYIMSPKQLTEQEYEELVINLLVRDTVALDNFSNEIEYSGVEIGLDPVWSEDYKQLIEPAKTLEKNFSDLDEMLNDVKPPENFEYEHETLSKAFNAHKNMAADIVSFVTNGDESSMESSEEFGSRAEQYLEESIFSSDTYKEEIMRAYQNSRLD